MTHAYKKFILKVFELEFHHENTCRTDEQNITLQFKHRSFKKYSKSNTPSLQYTKLV